jgi:GAF domain-containing protein
MSVCRSLEEGAMSTPNPAVSQPGRFRQLFVAPVFEGDEDKTRRARILNAILWIIEVATMAVGALGLLFATNALTGLIPIFGFLALASTGLVLLRKGFIEFTSFLLVVGLYGAETVLVLVSGGIFSPLISGYIVVMSAAGLLLNRRAFFVISGLSLVSMLGIALLQTGGLTLPTLIDISTPMQAAAAVVGNTFTAVLLFYLAVSSLSEALARTRQSNRDLELIRSSLEERVAARTAQLNASAEVGRAAASILNTDQLLRETVNLITDRFGFYYAAVFLPDETNTWAVLRAATGEAGRILKERRHQLEIKGQSMVGAVMTSRQARIALDVGNEAVRFANPLLPETRSEIALPLIAAGRMLGALDVQSTQMAAFDEVSAGTLQSMADQIAIALSNTLQFRQTQTALERTQQLYEASTAIAYAADAAVILHELMAQTASDASAAQILTYGPRDEAGQYAYFEIAAHWTKDVAGTKLPIGTRVPAEQVLPLLPAGREPQIIRDADDATITPEQQQLMQVLRMRALLSYALVAGSQPIGLLLIVYREPRMFTPAETQPLQALAGQIAVTLRNQQLVREQAQARTQLDEINRRLTGQAWEQYTRTRGQAVRKADVGPGVFHDTFPSELAAPVVVHGQEVGRLRLEDVTPDREWTFTEKALLQAVAGEVAIAIENARLLEQTQRDAQREQTISAITSQIYSTTDVKKLLQITAEELRRATGSERAVVRLGRGLQSAGPMIQSITSNDGDTIPAEDGE